MSITVTEAARRLEAAADRGTVDELCRGEGISLLVMFGSAAAGIPDPGDVDIAVRFRSGSRGTVVTLLDGLYRLTGYEGFDVLDLTRANPVARERALVGAVVLYEGEPGMFARQQIAAMMERMETAPFRRIELELMTR